MAVRTLLTVSLIAFVVGACGSEDDGGDAAESLGGEWTAVSGVSDGANVELLDGFAVTIGIDGDRIEGTAACNRYTGTVSIGDDGSFAAGDLSWTEIGCEPAVMGVEQAYLMSLGRFAEYDLGDGFLTLSSETDEWVFAQAVASDAGG